MTDSIPRIGIKRMRDEQPTNVSDIAIARLRALGPTYPNTLIQAVARLESLLATKNAAAADVRKIALNIEVEDAAELSERFADYRRLMGEADGIRQALDEINGGTS